MRIDEKGKDLPLTLDQRFFVTCWLNKIHRSSLDSHRVRTMNPLNILRELLRLYDLSHAGEEDRRMVCEEAVLVLSADPVLKQPSTAGIVEDLVELLKAESKGKGHHENLSRHVARELLHWVETTYVEETLRQLATVLLAEAPEGPLAARRDQIARLTCGLLSTLIDGGVSLESLYQLYRQILLPSFKSQRYVFARKLGLLSAILRQEAKEYRVLFCIDNVTDVEDFPTVMGGIKFAQQAPHWSADVGSVNSYLTPQSRRLFAEFTARAKDIRAAGSEAYAKISNVLDLARFEYERERVQLAEEYLVAPSDRPDRIARYPITKVVPNPAGIGGITDLRAFVTSVDELLSPNKFLQEGRDRVISAFRLYRLGADTNSFENKLANWWTAVEFLVRGLKGGKQIGSAVEHNVAPVLCLAYPGMLLIDIRQTLVKVGVTLSDPVTHAAVDLRDLPPLELCRLLQQKHVRDPVNDAFASEPYLQYRIGQILDALSDPSLYLVFLKAHEQRVRWQIQRLWRARCDIVHSARRPVSDVLLCANLEFYLKIALMSLLTDLRRIKTLSSPEEFFDRKIYTYSKLTADLERKSAVALHETLAAEWLE